jgi:ElaB/YqjD/DUF883 family membrane-anchored ribosome-binding protein
MESKGSKAANEHLDSSGNRITVDDLALRAHDKVDQLSDAVQPAVDRMTSNTHAAIDTVADAAVAAVDTEFMEGARAFMREQPIAALGIAVAAGWILSRLMR